MGYRRQARESAMSYLYQRDLGLPTSTDEPLKFAAHFELPASFREFFLDIVKGVLEKQERIDSEIEDVAEHWKLYRMERIDRAILRVATWELLEAPSTPYRVVLDEAVEIAKKFSTAESAAFVNGILDRLARKLRPDFPPPESEDGKDLVPAQTSK